MATILAGAPTTSEARSRWRDASPPHTFYPLAKTNRHAVAVVALEEGAGHERWALDAALRQLRKRLNISGVRYDLRRAALAKKSERATLKRLVARRRARKTAMRALRFEAREEARGRR